MKKLRNKKKSKTGRTTDMRPGWLYGWKDIAGYIGCSVRKAQCYAKDFNLPIYPLPTEERRKVIARPNEIDNWVKQVIK